MCWKATVGVHLSSEMAKTGLTVTASSKADKRCVWILSPCRYWQFEDFVL